MPHGADGRPRIALVAMPGGGKSTIGRHLARRLGLPFEDSDAVVEQRLGMPIRTYFETHGEPAFRAVETEVLQHLLRPDGPGLVLATGGGSVLQAQNRALLRSRATVVYIHTPPHELMRRLRHDTKRPLLQTADPLARLHQLAREREPLYRETAHFVLEMARPSIPSMVNMIAMQLEVGGVQQPGHRPPHTAPD